VVLRDEVPLRAAVRPGWTDGLSLLPASSEPDAGNLLARGLAQVVREARSPTASMRLDAPPVVGSEDGVTVAAAATPAATVLRPSRRRAGVTAITTEPAVSRRASSAAATVRKVDASPRSVSTSFRTGAM